jgi:hypothetical protein
MLELNRSDRAKPVSNLRRISLIHVEEVRHHRLHDRFAFVVGRHGNGTAEHFEQSAIPILNDIVLGSEAGIDEGAKFLANLLTSVPLRTKERTL